MKIISLVPSITESLFDFGLNDDEVIGRTKFCIHPASLVKNITIIGGTKNLNLEKIKKLQPDLIIANKEENDQSQVEELMRYFKVWVTDVANLADNARFIEELGIILKKESLALQFNKKIESLFKSIPRSSPKKVAYLIWKDPYMTVGADTFISDVLNKTGFENLFNHHTRYPVIEVEDLQEAELVFLSSEPYPFKEKHIAELQFIFPAKKIILVDGEAFSWFGTHLSKREQYLMELNSKFA